jgi:hypothetical protein
MVMTVYFFLREINIFTAGNLFVITYLGIALSIPHVIMHIKHIYLCKEADICWATSPHKEYLLYTPLGCKIFNSWFMK